jgi:hypothetical protein
MKPMTLPTFAANDDDLVAPPPAHAVVRTVNRAGRTLAVLLEIEDPCDGAIRVALDPYGAIAGSGFISGTVH